MNDISRGLFAATLTLACSTVQAHMKWFGNDNPMADVVSLGQILNTPFLLFIVVAIGVLFLSRK